MKDKRINGLMIFMSGAGGILGFIFSELLLNAYKYTLPQSILMGLYFGIIAFFAGLMCIIAEVIHPRLNGYNWKNNYSKTSLKFLVPCTFVLLFIVGALFQFIYGFDVNNKKVNDILLLIDTSESMKSTDPNNDRFEATKNLIKNMNEEKRFSIYTFDNKVLEIFPMTKATEKTKQAALEKLESLKAPRGQTNMKAALDTALKEIQSTKQVDRNAIVLLLSDGEDSFDLNEKFDEVIKPFQDNKISVYTVGMAKDNNLKMLKKISSVTNGNYYSVSESKNLKDIFSKIYKYRDQRLLVDKRNGLFDSIKFYAIMRIIFITLIGAVISTAISFMFDNKYLLKGFIIGGLVGGVTAGIILELGFKFIPWAGTFYRLIAAVMLTTIFTLFSVPVDVKDKKNGFFKAVNSKINYDSYSKNAKGSNTFGE
ncbi:MULTISPECIES: vWA domain-containing protein [Clostridium]|uniref:vWA domain-containing protein n=1 Tax=Clostridium TaxID=1485 RepID=UPI0013E92C87|nr:MULTISPECIES: vWA domain-containing protein [Clostridium]MBW9159299.1 VWA domain-containing protein [Clostridium tagluense]MBZ9623614.1 VWA domain-containing protein [Clostridium sp. FP2]MBZ9635038.1 VWA domain-containing protein [Clostridium sp. FP1]WLC67769.1 VWA domain-containing protein [Clostridium tagluense]